MGWRENKGPSQKVKERAEEVASKIVRVDDTKYQNERDSPPKKRLVPLRRTGSGIPWPYTIDEMIIALHECRGNISATARYLGCSRSTLYKQVEDTAELQTAVDDARDSILDDLETVLFDKALNGETVPLLFALKTQAKDRGWIENPSIQINQKFGNEAEKNAADDAAYLSEVLEELKSLRSEGEIIDGEVVEEETTIAIESGGG